MKEIWKDVKGFEGFYQVSNFGRVRSLDRFRQNGERGLCKVKGRMLKPYKFTPKRASGDFYWQVKFSVNGRRKKYNVHRLVAETFIPNTNRYPCVNHIDGNKQNNHVDNLEWCTYSHNNQHAYDNGLRHAPYLSSERAKRMRAKVDISWHYRQVIDVTTGKKYESINSTAQDGFRPSHVQKVCSGNAKTHRGHIFEYCDTKRR